MEVELVTDETSEDENYGLDDNSEDYLNFEGERCGICTDVVIDRGVLDCCQHWFCFACIDNWATITSLCPLCQNEFQLITCVPVYDTVGGNKTDDDTNPRQLSAWMEMAAKFGADQWQFKKIQILIHPLLVIPVINGMYHAFCVGFDTEGSCDGSWLCPRCTIGKGPQNPDRVSVLRKSYQNELEISGGDCQPEASFSGRVSVSVADDGETAILISLLEGNQESQESSKSVFGCSKDMESTLFPASTSDVLKSEALPGNRNSLEPNICQQELELSLSQDNCYSSSHSTSPGQLKISDEAVKQSQKHLNNEVVDSSLDLDLGLSMCSDISVHMKDNAEDHVPGSVEPNNRSEDLLQGENVVHNEIEVFSVKSTPDKKETASGITGVKRKHRDSRNADGEEGEANIESKLSQKKLKAESNSQLISLGDQAAVSVLDDPSSVSRRSSSNDSTSKFKSEKENGSSDIMDIVQGTDRRSLKQLGHKNSSDRESAAGLRLKKIMRRAGDDKDSSALVQELRKKIREAVRNKSSQELERNLFDPKLLNAFRAALAGSGAENRKPTLDVKAKRSLLQKGKVRESLTKKIYGMGGKRRRAWTRECEVEFWKHRCIKASKPEKIQTLKKNDIKPVSAQKAAATSEQKTESGLTGKASIALPIDQSEKTQKENSLLQVTVSPLDGKEMKKSIKGMKAESASGDAHQKRHPKGAPAPASGGMKITSEKDMAGKSEIKGDKRKWALEVLARKTAASSKNTPGKEEDSAILKGNYTLLAQLPKDMRPVLATSRHNKIPISVRQTQLYRLTEHFLKKANASVACRTAETELAVADAVNIEKQVADRSNSKLVYLNLCSQELLRRSDDMNSDRAKEPHPCSTSESLSDTPLEETSNSSLDLVVDEALKRAGLMSDSPPNSPNHTTEDIKNEVGSPGKSDDEGPDNMIEVDAQPDLDIYGDFEYNLEDDDFIGAGALNVSKLEPEPPKIKLLFSSLKSEEPNGILGLHDNEAQADLGGLSGTSVPLESQNKASTGDRCLVQNSSVDDDDDCEELYGPDKEPLIKKCPETAFVTPSEQTVIGELPGETGDCRSNQIEKNSGQPSCMENVEVEPDGSKQSPSNSKKREKETEKAKTTKGETKQSEENSMVEAYIKEHIRPLCKSGVITVDQYRWAVGKTTEKVMKYHSKEKTANFLIKEGEKVKKLAEQYVEAAPQKTKT
ncbi:UNVERIFIED_CONTAM: hypothetical protein Slati_1902800 [Sesamum latifolium]|uniref:RING-type domain-containing protein n=1 Tax=Sesamum latifolium TaxID=2727402 RepID=A0AAW2X382_9LAMI